MLNKTIITLTVFLWSAQFIVAAPGAKIVSIKGEVKIRRGLEEKWRPAAQGMSLEIIDSIVALEGEVVLEIEPGLTFQLGSHAMVDISDLRRITKKDLFLYLMSEKVRKIPPNSEKTRLRIANVSVVHGESKASTQETDSDQLNQKWRQEFNGAKAMFFQKYYPNTILKLHKMSKNYSSRIDFGELHFYLGKAFERLDEQGQALDAYQTALQQSNNCELSHIVTLRNEAQSAIEKLKK